ncbi:hypothetical protein GGF44_001465 [Coemansia sp. RSA 1694]|nr:hypothetical protein GGH95_004228 [Coemansia sp. RSA 1836]KAJ2642827.1 hypothetical protein GGF44_001465 [Coemansia sp. RSA 1694]
MDFPITIPNVRSISELDDFINAHAGQQIVAVTKTNEVHESVKQLKSYRSTRNDPETERRVVFTGFVVRFAMEIMNERGLVFVICFIDDAEKIDVGSYGEDVSVLNLACIDEAIVEISAWGSFSDHLNDAKFFD